MVSGYITIAWGFVQLCNTYVPLAILCDAVFLLEVIAYNYTRSNDCFLYPKYFMCVFSVLVYSKMDE